MSGSAVPRSIRKISYLNYSMRVLGLESLQNVKELGGGVSFQGKTKLERELNSGFSKIEWVVGMRRQVCHWVFWSSLVSVFDSLAFAVEIVDRRRGCRISSRMGIRDSHSSTKPAVPRGPQVERLMVGFFLGLATMRTFSLILNNRIGCLEKDASCAIFPSKFSQQPI